MSIIRIDFIDFWEGFNKTDNYFYNLLSQKYTVQIDSFNPDFIIYSCFGQNYLNYSCKRIYYTGENIRPDFSSCDLAFSFDFNRNKKHFRLPLYSLYIEELNMLKKLESKKSFEEAKKVWQEKTNFCCMVVSSPKSSKRLDFFKKLSKFRKIDSGGKQFNNVGGPVENKLEFIKNYKFVMAFENSSHNGYTTEKILESIYVDAIPIYYGNKLINRDFNPKRFINYNDFKSEEALYRKLTEIENNPDIAIKMLMEPVFSENKLSHIEEKEKVLLLIEKVLFSNNKPIAKTYKRKIHYLKLLKKKIFKKLNKFLIKNILP